MSLSFVDELQAQVEKLEKQSWRRKPPGMTAEETGWRFRTSRR
jgi:hypothetical protein